MSAFNPIVHDMYADAVPPADLVDRECPGRARRTRNPMLETDPIYHVVSEGLASRAPESVAIEQSSNAIVVILACQVANSVNERCRITKYIRTVCRQPQLDYLSCPTLPTNLQLQLLVLWPLDNGDILDQQSEHTFAIARFRCRGCPQTWEVFGKLQDLTLEVGELGLKLENTLCRVIPALLERTGDQSIVGIY